MRNLKYTLCAILCLVSLTCSAQRLLSEAASIKGVSSVYIGKTMLKLAGTSMTITGNQSAIDLQKIFKDLSSIEIISCEDKASTEKVNKKCRTLLSKFPLEVITETSSDGQNIQISGVFGNDGKKIEILLIAVTGKDEVSFILLKGNIDVVTLNNAIFAN